MKRTTLTERMQKYLQTTIKETNSIDSKEPITINNKESIIEKATSIKEHSIITEKEALINKACEWLDKNIGQVYRTNPAAEVSWREHLVESFRKAMEEKNMNDEQGNEYKKCTYQDILNNISSLNNKQLRKLVELCIFQVQKNSFKWMYSKGCNYVSKPEGINYYKMQTKVIDDFTKAMEE